MDNKAQKRGRTGDLSRRRARLHAVPERSVEGGDSEDGCVPEPRPWLKDGFLDAERMLPLSIVEHSGSHKTPRWREADSNSWSRFEKTPSKMCQKVPSPSAIEAGTTRRGIKS